MARLPKPLIGLLLGTVAFFAVWMVALKPSSSSPGGSPSGVGQYQPAINQAHQAVTTSNAANAKLGAPTSTASAAKPTAPAKTPRRAGSSSTPAKVTHAAHATSRAAPARPTIGKGAVAPETPWAPVVTGVQDSLIRGDVLAVLFFNPASADDLAMVKELAHIPQDYKSAYDSVDEYPIPISALSQFPMITAQVPVVTSPTLVIIDRHHRATVLTGYASQLEINQRVADARAAK